MHKYPKLHNAMWPGVVGKGPDAEPPIDLDTMLDLTAAAEVDGVKFDGVDLFLFDPHVSIDSTDDELEAPGRQGRVARPGRRLGRRAGLAADRRRLGDGRATRTASNSSTQVRKACRIAKTLSELGVRPYGVVRIDSAAQPERLGRPIRRATRRRSPRPSAQACDVAEEYGERLAAEGEICWGGMHSWKRMVELLELVEPPEDARLPGRHGPHAPLHARLQRARGPHPARGLRLERRDNARRRATRRLTDALRPWTIDFHVAQNNATVYGSGSHDKTGRHCLPNDPNGKLDIVKHAGYWLRDERATSRKRSSHICWDGCMFPNER